MSESSHADVMLAGAAAAFTVDLLIYPLDTLKTRQQSQDFVKTFADPDRATKLPSRSLFRGLYQGIGIVVVATLPAAGTFFTTYEAAKSLLLGGEEGRSKGGSRRLPLPLVHAAASAAAECASCLVLTPAEVVKQNAQMLQRQTSSSSSSPASPLSSSSTSLQALRMLRGRALLRGYSALVARNLPFTALQFPLFEAARARIWGRRRRRQRQGGGGAGGGNGNNGSSLLLETGAVTGLSAGAAGSFAALVTTPMDVVKTRMMLSAAAAAGDDGHEARGRADAAKREPARRGKGSLAVARDVVRERGVRGLFRGGLLRSVWTAVGSGLYLGTYEAAKVWLTERRTSSRSSAGGGEGGEDASFS
ncbi:mitochondrial carrier [Xylariomycetidae sp. FL0641]|nr:mitochondrial carrier [Xylariomycetidae sp. FL0641]